MDYVKQRNQKSQDTIKQKPNPSRSYRNKEKILHVFTPAFWATLLNSSYSTAQVGACWLIKVVSDTVFSPWTYQPVDNLFIFDSNDCFS